MSTLFKRFLLAVCFVFMGIAASFSATYWLPDYKGFSSLGDQGSGPLPPTPPNPGGKKTCKDYGMYARGEMPAKTVCSQRNPGGGLTCFTDCKCPAEYAYDSDTNSNLVCSDSCTDESGKTKYKCAECRCPDGFEREPDYHPTYIGWSLCGNLKEEGDLMSANGEGKIACGGFKRCYRCVDVCGSGKKYCSGTGSCVSADGCCTDTDCRYSTGHCDMDSHTCKSVCEEGYSEEKPTCPNGKTLCQQEGNTSCWGCCGTECNSGYSTSTTAETCKDGQTFETQADNEACGICRGVACESGYATNIVPYSPINSNFGSINKRPVFGLSNDNILTLGQVSMPCAMGQTVQTQSTNSNCAKCVGTACDTANGFNLGIELACLDGQTRLSQDTNSSCEKCEGVACEVGYSTKAKLVDNIIQKLVSQETNPKCTKLVDIQCSTGYFSGNSCFPPAIQEIDPKEPLCSRCLSCEDRGQKTCGTKCIAATACCTNGTEGCSVGQKCDSSGICVAKTCEDQGLKTCNGTCIAADGCCASSECGTGYTCTNNTCTEIPCEAGYSKPLASFKGCKVGYELVTQMSNPNCKKCEEVPCEDGYSKNVANCLSGQTMVYQTTNLNCKKCEGDASVICAINQKQCGAKCIAKTACCTNGEEGCPLGQTCNNGSCGSAIANPCGSGKYYCTGTRTVTCVSGIPTNNTSANSLCTLINTRARVCGETYTYEECCSSPCSGETVSIGGNLKPVETQNTCCPTGYDYECQAGYGSGCTTTAAGKRCCTVPNQTYCRVACH